MGIGSLVHAIYMAHLGIGVIEWVAPNGMLVVSFEVDGQRFCDEFHAHELENAKPMLSRTA